MYNGMPCDLIQGQGHGASGVPKIALFKVYFLRYLLLEENYVPCKNLITIPVKIATYVKVGG